MSSFLRGTHSLFACYFENLPLLASLPEEIRFPDALRLRMETRKPFEVECSNKVKGTYNAELESMKDKRREGENENSRYGLK